MKAQIVSFTCTLTDRLGKVISSTYSRDVLTATDPECEADVLPRLLEGLQHLQPGERRRVELSAEDAYGFYRPELAIRVSRSELERGPELVVGDVVPGKIRGGEWLNYCVVGADRESVELDANHPLAGQDLVFDIQAIETRDKGLGEEFEGSRVLH